MKNNKKTIMVNIKIAILKRFDNSEIFKSKSKLE